MIAPSRQIDTEVLVADTAPDRYGARAEPRRLGGDVSGEAGTALVEMAFVISLLSLVLFGIMTFGYLMSFKQNLTQAAAEGARAGAVAPSGFATTRADTATADAVGGFGQTCNSGGLTCTVTIASCGSNQCVTVNVTYDYKDHPLLPPVPLLGSAVPDTISAQSTAEIDT